jgi:uncharacterized protein (TIGR00251 family)
MTSIIPIRVTPRSAKPAIAGWRVGADGREELEVRVAQPPADGAANEAVVRLLAKALNLPKSSVEIVGGASSRHKRVTVPLGAEEVKRLLGR